MKTVTTVVSFPKNTAPPPSLVDRRKPGNLIYFAVFPCFSQTKNRQINTGDLLVWCLYSEVRADHRHGGGRAAMWGQPLGLSIKPRDNFPPARERSRSISPGSNFAEVRSGATGLSSCFSGTFAANESRPSQPTGRLFLAGGPAAWQQVPMGA